MYLKSCPGANVRKSRHVTGKNVSDSDSDMEVTLHGGRGAKGGTGVGNAATTPGAGSSVSKKKFSSVLFPPVRKEIAGLQPIEKRMCPMDGCDSSGHLGEFVKKAFSNVGTPILYGFASQFSHDRNLHPSFTTIFDRKSSWEPLHKK